MFSNILSFLSSRNVNDQVSHPYKTIGKIIVLYILIIYGVQTFIPVLPLRTLRFPEIRTWETTDELGWVIVTNLASRILRWLIDCFGVKIVYRCTEVM